jgi:hypothetical protein
MVDFASLKKNRQSSLEKLTAELTKMNTPANGGEDTRFWQPSVDKAGNGSATIRFLPAPGAEDVPFVRLFDHAFKGPTGKWYIEKSLTTLGQNDPVSEYNSKLWNASTDDKSPEREQVRKQKRRLYYISNIYVIKDSAHPENEGKVFLFKYGKKIFDKLNDLMNPSFEDETPVNPYDLWEGANFRLKIRQVDGYRNYDKSDFADVAPLLEDDEELEKIWKSEYSLTAFLQPSEFKPYADLKKRLNEVLALDEEDDLPVRKTTKTAKKVEVDEEDESPFEVTPKRKVKETSSDEGEEDFMEYFKNLTKED